MLTLLTFPKASSHFLWSFSRFVAQGKNWRANSALNSASDLRKERDGDSANCWETGSPHTHTHDFPPRTEQGDTMPSICLIILSIEQPALTTPYQKTAYFARKCSFSPPLIVPLPVLSAFTHCRCRCSKCHFDTAYRSADHITDGAVGRTFRVKVLSYEQTNQLSQNQVQ